MFQLISANDSMAMDMIQDQLPPPDYNSDLQNQMRMQSHFQIQQSQMDDQFSQHGKFIYQFYVTTSIYIYLPVLLSQHRESIY